MTKKLLNATRVLLVEDEFLIAMDVEQLCRDHGAQDVQVVGNHSDLGTDLLERMSVDAAILDVKLQGEWTVDFAHLLAEREIPFIFATGYSDLDILVKEFPHVPVVGKPYTGGEMVDALTAAMRGKPAGEDIPTTD